MTIQLTNLTFTDRQRTILQLPPIEFASGQTHLIIGNSGAGKSTLLKIIANLYPKYRGQLTGTVTGNDHVAMVFQHPGLQFTMDTPRHELNFVLMNQGVPPSQQAEQITTLATKFGITNHLDQPFTTLSGGEQQLVALATAMAMQPKILLLDEALASLDVAHQTQIIQQLQALQQAGLTIIIADHEPAIYQALHPNVYELQATNFRKLTPAETNAYLHPQLATATFSLPTGNESLTATDLTIQTSSQTLYEHQSFSLPNHAITLLTGPSGSGKTSFLKACFQLIPYTGQLNFQGHDLTKWRRKRLTSQLGWGFQQAADQFIQITVAQELAVSLKHSHQPTLWQAHQADILQQLRLTELLDRSVYTLSGGQQKIVQILSLLILAPPLLFLDEPFVGLDPAIAQQIANLIQTWQQLTQMTIIIISHRIAPVIPIADYHLTLHQQQWSFTEELTYETQSTI